MDQVKEVQSLIQSQKPQYADKFNRIAARWQRKLATMREDGKFSEYVEYSDKIKADVARIRGRVGMQRGGMEESYTMNELTEELTHITISKSVSIHMEQIQIQQLSCNNENFDIENLTMPLKVINQQLITNNELFLHNFEINPVRSSAEEITVYICIDDVSKLDRIKRLLHSIYDLMPTNKQIIDNNLVEKNFTTKSKCIIDAESAKINLFENNYIPAHCVSPQE